MIRRLLEECGPGALSLVLCGWALYAQQHYRIAAGTPDWAIAWAGVALAVLSACLVVRGWIELRYEPSHESMVTVDRAAKVALWLVRGYVLWSVVLPVSRNGTVTAALFAFLWAWSDFVFAATLDSGGSLQPLTLGIYRYIGNNNQEWNAIMATAVVASVPATVLLVLAQRFVAAGITAGAVRD